MSSIGMTRGSWPARQTSGECCPVGGAWDRRGWRALERCRCMVCLCESMGSSTDNVVSPAGEAAKAAREEAAREEAAREEATRQAAVGAALLAEKLRAEEKAKLKAKRREERALEAQKLREEIARLKSADASGTVASGSSLTLSSDLYIPTPITTRSGY